MIFNLVIPWAPSAAVFIVFRLFAGFGASAPLAVGAGIISDMFVSENRGQAVALCTCIQDQRMYYVCDADERLFRVAVSSSWPYTGSTTRQPDSGLYYMALGLLVDLYRSEYV